MPIDPKSGIISFKENAPFFVRSVEVGRIVDVAVYLLGIRRTIIAVQIAVPRAKRETNFHRDNTIRTTSENDKLNLNISCLDS